MTLLASFTSNAVHYIVSDAAITTRGPLARGPRKSSFGEKHRATRQGFVREEGLKLYRLGDAIVGAYCGPVHSGMAALDHIKRHLSFGETFDQAVVGAQSLLGSAELVLVGPDSANIWRRWLVTAERISEDYDESVVRIAGSARPELRTFVQNAYRTFFAVPEIRANPHHALTAAIVGIQAHAQRADLIEQGIGGTFWGLGARAAGFIAQRDILYILFNADERAEARVHVETLSAVVSGQREDIAFAWRVRLRNKGLRVFVGDVSYVSNEDIRAAARTMLDVQPHYLALVERRSGAVLLCAREHLDDERLFALRYRDGALALTLSAQVVRHLSMFPGSSANEEALREVPFVFLG